MGQPCADHCISQGDPDHIARDRDAECLDGAGQSPQDHHETTQRDNVGQQAEPKRQAGVGEVPQVLGDTLVGVVGADRGAVAGQADIVIGSIRQPLGQELAGQPTSPADLQQLMHIHRIDPQDDVNGCQLTEARNQATGRVAVQENQIQKRAQVLVLQGVVEFAAPETENDTQADQGQVHRNDRQQQAPRGPPLRRRHEVRAGEPPGVS